jgi:hypothetical protein
MACVSRLVVHQLCQWRAASVESAGCLWPLCSHAPISMAEAELRMAQMATAEASVASGNFTRFPASSCWAPLA